MYDDPQLNPTNQENILRTAERLTDGSRQACYGHPLDDYTRTGVLWGALLYDWARKVVDHPIPVPPELATLCMCAVKLSRETHAHGRDNLVDLAGYARCTDEIHRERARREGPWTELTEKMAEAFKQVRERCDDCGNLLVETGKLGPLTLWECPKCSDSIPAPTHPYGGQPFTAEELVEVVICEEGADPVSRLVQLISRAWADHLACWNCGEPRGAIAGWNRHCWTCGSCGETYEDVEIYTDGEELEGTEGGKEDCGCGNGLGTDRGPHCLAE